LASWVGHYSELAKARHLHIIKSASPNLPDAAS